MDSLAHTLCGISLAKSGFSKKWGWSATAILGVTSNIPDIDAITLFIDPYSGFLYKRMFTHSIIFLPIISTFTALIFRTIFKHIPFKAIFGMCFLAITIHIFFDLLNSYGVVLLFPFSYKRFELAWVFIVDLVMWGLLLIPHFLSLIFFRFKNKELFHIIVLILVYIYIIFCGISNYRASVLLKNIANSSKINYSSSYVFPEAFGIHHFRGVVKENSLYYMYLINTFTGKIESSIIYKTHEDNIKIQELRKTEQARNIEWFFKLPVWRITNNSEAEVFDLRFQSMILPSHRSHFTFRLKLDTENRK